MPHLMPRIGNQDGSVTTVISRAVKEAKKSITFKKDKSAVVHVGLGRSVLHKRLYVKIWVPLLMLLCLPSLQGSKDARLFMTPLAPKYYINYKLMKKKVKQFARQIKAGGLERRYVLKDFSIMLDNQDDFMLRTSVALEVLFKALFWYALG
ncbi:hypothetical protein L1987_75053 [Smallanthus sonchifolius]|uniref:Uncharacterized protein n=1 Tax=Smallanthus sonchifolius TaxID=185202 RepID=A0ACB9A4D6_9ASTR|nr:hypothetical protein L1987_75053 [Smallanthus sonchifolius]